MATPNKKPIITPDMTAAQKRQAVETLLHELAYVLHVTRKVRREAVWPAAPARPRSATAVPAAAV